MTPRLRPNNTLDRPAGSHSLAAAGQRGRWTDERMAASMIFVKGESAQQPLGEFVARVRVALGLTDVTERESSNYADGSYFLGALDDARVKLYYLDTVGLEDYLFAVHVEPSDDRRVAGLARSISKVGFSCFVPAGPWHLLSWDGVGTAYEP